MKEKYFSDLGLDSGEELLNKFNLSELIDIENKEDDDEKNKEENN